MEKRKVERPERLDNLPSQFIYKVPRNHEIFKNRSWKKYDWTKGINVLFEEIKIPDDQIICDSCNFPIQDEKINLIVYIDEISGKTLADQALCEKCKKKRYSELIIIGE